MRFLSTCLLSLSLLVSSQAFAEPLRERLVIIGIDGLTFDVIEPLIEQGKLPTFQKLIKTGSRATLMSEKPMRSPALWTTIATGQPRAKHRIFDFVTGSWYWTKAERHKKQRLVTSDMRESPALWNMASDANKKSVVVGWLNTWPAEQIKGSMIAPYVALGQKKQTSIKGKIYLGAKNQTWPTALSREIAPLIRSAESITPEEIAQIVQPLLAAPRRDAVDASSYPVVFLEGVDGGQRVSERLSGAQELAVVIGDGEPKHDPDPRLIRCGQHRGGLGNRWDGLGKKAVHVLRLELNQFAILLNGLLEGQLGVGAVAGDQRGQ